MVGFSLLKPFAFEATTFDAFFTGMIDCTLAFVSFFSFSLPTNILSFSIFDWLAVSPACAVEVPSGLSADDLLIAVLGVNCDFA